MSATSFGTVAPGGFGTGVSDTVALIGRHLRHLRRTPEKIIAVTLTPVAMVGILGYLFASVVSVQGTAQYHDYVMGGVFAQVALSCVGVAALGVSADLRTGLIDRFRSLPMARSTVLVSHTAADLVTSAVAVVGVSLAGLAVGWRIHKGFLPAALGFVLILAFAYAMLWLGALLGMVMRNAEAINGVSALVLVIFSFLSSSFMPLTGLPTWLRTVAEWNPVSVVSAACRQLWGNAPAAAHGSLAVQHPVLLAPILLAAMIGVLMPVSMRVYRTAVVR
ncbi:ABC transporter permease [Kitasatospora mediocidica]|uniref:ABC transporter permease n=1 Tax=Kitasatospora mediocidica TaxID=58352 RepID=UPI0006895CAE|nr:ABC transporter permease [Kitasatospora mediocidica]